MLLDNHTLVFSLMLISAMMALSLAVVSWGREHDSLKKWAGAMALESAAFLLLASRGEIPDVISIVFPVVLVIAAQALKLAAIYEYRDLPWPRWQCLLPIGMGILIFAALPYEDFRGRLIYGSLIYGAQMLLILQILRTDTESRAGRAWWLLFGATVVILPFSALRAIVAFFRLAEFATIQSTVAPNPVQMAIFICLIAMSMLGSLGFILMVKERADRAIRSLAMIDSLTMVFNRRAFMERAEKEYAIAQRNQTPLALLMIDIDYFKRINDEFGHPTGDRVLVDVAQLLDSRLRKQDTLGRYGGEEFCILLPATDEVGAMAVAETLRNTVESTPLATKRNSISATISVGVTVCTTNCDKGFYELLDNSDAALYQAKHEGRNRTALLTSAAGTHLKVEQNS
jgi:diguanylate cyclase (GGDEF)-like protein